MTAPTWVEQSEADEASSAPRWIYLDQNAWIQLSRQDQGKTEDPLLAEALRVIKEQVTAGRARFPLSSSHYIETYKRGAPESRQRLGRFMFSLAGLDRIVDATKLLIPELHTALANELDLPAAPPAQPFGRGFAHVFPEAGDPYSPPVVAAAIAQLGRQAVEEMLELEMIAGPAFGLPAHGIARPDDTFSMRQLKFEQGTRERLRAVSANSDLARRLVLAQEVPDLVDPLTAFLMKHNTSADPWRTQQGLTDLLLSLPAKGAITRMRYTAHQNPNFKWSMGDLHDLVALGTAAGYCDIVVCEKHWGSILQRHQRHLRARILTSLRELPQVAHTLDSHPSA